MSVSKEAVYVDGAALQQLENEVDLLAESIGARVRKSEGDALAEVGRAPEVERIRNNARALPGVAKAFAAKIQVSDRNLNLSIAGKADARRSAEAERDAALDRIMADVADAGDKLLERFPANALAAPSADVAAQVQMVASMFPHALPATFMGDALQVLRIASTASSGNERFRANNLLVHAYVPLLRRRATAPEHHAVLFASVAQRALDVIQQHLWLDLKHDCHELAALMVGQARVQIGFGGDHIRQFGNWDSFVAGVGMPLFANDLAAAA